MTSHDSGDSGRGPGRQDPREFLVTRDAAIGQHDSALSRGDRADKPSPPVVESRYGAAAWAGATKHPGIDPLSVKITFVVVHGTAAEELIKRQGAAVRDALEWFASHPPDETDGGRHDRTTA
ncbi:hypothetical protein AB0J80_12170 [Actinoplanes sp. NPDC049548]|uniref:hypothetical protein n=1 Tax=Actinoplanes sp. NPDC049548 TaxID=3155152 RepID=UPI003417B084